jgi:mannose-6-phosphate isomerase-like protein (cupin superfamily)
MQVKKEKSSPLEVVRTFKPRMANNNGGLHVPAWLSFETLDRLISTMDVQVIALSECVVGPGFALDLNECDTPSFHYIREGHGRLYTPNEMPVEIGPQTLIIVPPKCPFRFELTSPNRSEIESVQESQGPNQTETMAFMLCGIFRSLYGNSVDLFDTLHVPIIEQFSKDDALELRLQLALTELIARNVCSDVLVSTAMKQVIVALIRRSFLSLNSWTRRFAVLSVVEHESARAQVNSIQG